MYQRPRSERQHLGDTNVHSPFFVSSESKPTTSPYANNGSYGASSGQQYYYGQQQQHQQTPPPQSAYDAGNTQYYQPPPSNRKKHQNSNGGGFSYLFLLFWTAMMVLAAYAYVEQVVLPKQVQIQIELEESKLSKARWKDKYHDLERLYDTLEKTHVELEHKAEELEAHVEELEHHTNHHANNANNHEQHIQDLTRQLEQLQGDLTREQSVGWDWKGKAEGHEKTIELLKKNIQEFSKKHVLQKFGPGPHKVELELSFSGGTREKLSYLTLEMAPLDDMPHTNYIFLEQVDRGLYNNGHFSFHHNAIHVIQGAPSPDAMSTFTDSGVGTVLFSEYSVNFPHQPYTVGLAGRPGGPDFYFNTQDNSQSHGPNGYAADGSADPCFAKVTVGFEVVDRMHGLTGALQHGDWKEITPSIQVLKAHVYH